MQIYNKIFHWLLIFLWSVIKASVIVAFIIVAVYDGMIIKNSVRQYPVAGSETFALVIEYLYLLSIFITLIYMAVWAVLGLNKKHYLIFVGCLSFYGTMYFLPPVQLTQRAESCLSNGHVWDGDLQQCRDDCLTWNEKDGRVPL